MIIEIPAEKPRMATKKQLDFIETIEETLRIKFEGETCEEAREWIDEHIADFQHVQELINYGKEDDYDNWFEDGDY